MIIDTLVGILTLQLCTVSVVVGMEAELDEWAVGDVRQTEDRIVSQWREVSADQKHQLRGRFDEILRPLGYETSLVVIRPASSIALYFICMTLSAVTSLHDQWRTGQLRRLVEFLFAFLTGATGRVYIKRLTWPLFDYKRCLDFFSSARGQQTT